MAKRRPLTGKPLLLASATVAVAVGCGGPGGVAVSGNLMPPPKVTGEVCVSATPEGATILIDGVPADEPCETVESYDTVTVEVSAPGYLTHSSSHSLTDKVDVPVALEPIPAEKHPPVGNLMPPPDREPPPPPPPPPPPVEPLPPPPPPVGNLMPPPEIRPKEDPALPPPTIVDGKEEK